MSGLNPVWQHFFEQALHGKHAQDNERKLTAMTRHGAHIMVAGQQVLNLASNDYLALGSHTELKQAFMAQLDEQSAYLSASSSRLLTGHSPWHEYLEQQLATAFGREAALCFGTGYQTNMGILSALADASTLILADKLVHASLIDGMLLSKAKFYRYRHNDIAHLQALLAEHHPHHQRTIIVTESIFSMDGDVADLSALVRLKQQYANVALYVDEAHAVGVRGVQGLGCAEEQQCVQGIDFLVGAFGKALHSVGGYVVCSQLAKQYLINHMRPLIFSTGLPPLNVAWSLFVLQHLSQFQAQRQHLQAISQQLHAAVADKHGVCLSQSHIVPVVTGSNASAVAKAAALLQQGLLVMAVRPPTVPPNQARLRICLNAGVGVDSVQRLVDCL